MSLSQGPARPTEGALHLCDFSLSQQPPYVLSYPGGCSLRVSQFSVPLPRRLFLWKWDAGLSLGLGFSPFS